MAPNRPPTDSALIAISPLPAPHALDTRGAGALEEPPRNSAELARSVVVDYCPYRNTPSPLATELVREQSSCTRLAIQEPHLYRHRRLDLPAMARRVLSGQAAAVERARICRLQADLDRDQRHLLRLAEAGELSQMGARGARRFHLFA